MDGSFEKRFDDPCFFAEYAKMSRKQYPLLIEKERTNHEKNTSRYSSR